MISSSLSAALAALGQAFSGYGQDRQRREDQDYKLGQLTREFAGQGIIPQSAAPRTLSASLGGVPGIFGNPTVDLPTNYAPVGTYMGQSFVKDPNWLSPEARAEAAAGRIASREQANQTSADANRQRLDLAKQRRDYNTLRLQFPNDPLSKSPFDETNPADYSAALIYARQQPKNIDPLSPGGIAAGVSRAAQIAALKPKTLTPDQVKSQTVNDLAGPAADDLLNYHETGGLKQGTAAIAGHVPGVGSWLQGKIDPAYQTALNSARTLATQYLEIMPKSRFQPSTVDDIMSQIAPSPSDSPELRVKKIARVKTLKAAIAKRANNPTDLPDLSLDDAPPPPGIQP